MLQSKPTMGEACEQVEAFAFGHVAGLGNIKKDDVAEFGGSAPVGSRGADVSGADDGDFRTSHEMRLRKFEVVL